MPRVSIRKAFIYLLGMASFALLVLNIHQNMVGSYSWSGSGPSGSGQGPGPAEGSGSGSGPIGPKAEAPVPDIFNPKPSEYSRSNVDKLDVDKKPLLPGDKNNNEDDDDSKGVAPVSGPAPYKVNGSKANKPRKAMDMSPLDPSDMTIPSVKERPWYMPGGELVPKQCPVDPVTGQRDTVLLPEDQVGSDRIPEQLMFIPPAGTTIPDNPEDPSTPLKKILLWNGVSSWGNTRPGRGTFIKEKCPVTTCAITTSRTEATSADLVLFKVRRCHVVNQSAII